MFSFVGDTVLDPFAGTGTTSLAASLWGRNSIGFEVEPVYFEMACGRIEGAHAALTLPGLKDELISPEGRSGSLDWMQSFTPAAEAVHE